MNELVDAAADVDQAAVIEQLLNDRYSCRAYLEQPVPREHIERLLRTAQRSASWCNTQPWQLIVTSGKATMKFRKALVDFVKSHPGHSDFDFEAPTQYTGKYLERRRTAGWQLYEAVGVEKGDRVASAKQAIRNFHFFGAPHVAIVTTDAEQGTYGAVDAGLYVGTFLLAAESLGVAAIAQAALAQYSGFIREYFGIADDRKVLVGISFGYPDRDHPANSYRTARAPLSQVVSWLDD